MKKLLLIQIFLLSLFANPAIKITKNESNFNVSGKFMTYYSDITETLSDNTKENEGLSYASLQLNIDYENNGWYFQATPYMYACHTKSGEPIKNPVMYKPYDRKGLFFRSFYLSYTYNNWTIGAGVLPFSNSVPMKFSDNVFQDGAGINTINDNDLTAIFFKYKTENSNTIFGYGIMEDILVPTGKYIGSYLRPDTDVYFLINTYEKDKWTVTNELMYVDMKFKKVDISKIYLYGLAVSWDDTQNSGLAIYNVSAGSIYENESENATDEIMNTIFEGKNPYAKFGVSNTQYGAGVMNKYPSSFNLADGKKAYGASNLFGIRYEMDYFPMETFINVEWFHTFGDWISGNQGNMYNAKLNQTYTIRDNSYYINYGVLLSKNSLLRFTYSYLEFNEYGKIGAPATTVPAKDFLGGSLNVRKKIETFHLIYTYKF